MSQIHELFMKRCFDLAYKGKANVSPNPMVGAVLVYNNKIIGEGFHKAFGSDHAEVNAINSVKPQDRYLIPQSTLYVSLEPCCFHGKTPACTDLIRRCQIKKVVISALDPTPEVNGQGVKQLRDSGVEVISGILDRDGEQFIAARREYIEAQRPWITIKFAQTQNGYFAPNPASRKQISGPMTSRFVHKLRSEADAILIGINTLLTDNPHLTTRNYSGASPTRIIVGDVNRLHTDLNIFNKVAPTLVYHNQSTEIKIPDLNCEIVVLSDFNLQKMFKDLKDRGIGKILVEGGVKLLESLFAEGLWDETFMIRGTAFFTEGIPAPLPKGILKTKMIIGSDEVLTFVPSVKLSLK